MARWLAAGQQDFAGSALHVLWPVYQLSVASKQKNKAKEWALHRHTLFCNGAKFGEQLNMMLRTAVSVQTAVKMGVGPDLTCETVDNQPVTWQSQIKRAHEVQLGADRRINFIG